MERPRSRKDMDRLEKHIKKKLQERVITPSTGAWDKIAAELKSEEGFSSSKKVYWWAVAAGLTGMILLTIGFFAEQKPEAVNEKIVFEEEAPKENLPGVESQTLVQDETRIVSKEKLVLDTPKTKETAKKEEWLIEDKNHNQVANAETVREKEPLNDAKEVTDLAITNKLEEVLAQVNAMENGAITVSDAEIDSLLMNAQKELLTEKVLGKGGTVDALALLNEVEMELYDDLRNPLFIKLKEGFFKLRTAVADRNN